MADKQSSKFWAGSDSSASDTEESSSSEEEEVQQKQEPRNRWQYESDSSEDLDQRVVKSARRKADDAFEKVHHELQNSLNINDWNNISTLFNKLPGLLTKHADVVQTGKAGSMENYPDFYFLSLKVIQDAITELSSNKAAQRKLSKTNVKSFNALRARFKKLIDENLQKKIDDAQHNASARVDSESDSDSDSSASSSSEYDSESESSSDDDKSQTKGKRTKSLDDSEDWDSDSDESSSSDEEGPQLTGRARWLKKIPGKATQETNEEKRLKDQEKQERAKKRKMQKEIDQENKEKEVKKDEEAFTEEVALERTKEVLMSRGKKSINKLELVAKMKVLADRSVVFGPKFHVPLMMHLVALQFDVKTGLDDYMPVNLWLECLSNISQIVAAVEANGFVLEQFTGGDDDDEEVSEDSKTLRIQGDLSVFVDRLNTEYEKSLRCLDNHSEEYISRLQHEGAVNDIARRVFKYYERVGDNLKCAVMSIITLQNNYYKHESFAKPVYHAQLLTKRFGDRGSWHPAAIGGDSASATVHPGAELGSLSKLAEDDANNSDFNLSREIIDDCKVILKHGTKEMKCVATLSQVYHYALHDNYFKARDLLLMSKLQESIYTFEVDSQILFNRTLAQLGFCGFRAGRIKYSHSSLMDLCQQGSKTKELLAQGVYWRKQMQGMDAKALEAFQKQERRRLLPFHLHINLDLLEFHHLTAAMLLEVPNMALQESAKASGTATQTYTKILSRTFRRHLEQYKKQVFTGPPETTRDHILAAATKLQEGDWKSCCDLLMNLSVWKLFTSRVQETKELLTEEIKKQALRTYLISYGAMYSSLGVEHVKGLFSMSEDGVRKVVNKMIVDDELRASWDKCENGLVLLLRANQPTHLQALAGRFAAQLEKLVDSNEKKASKGQPGFEGFSKSDESKGRGNFKYRKNPRRNIKA